VAWRGGAGLRAGRRVPGLVIPERGGPAVLDDVTVVIPSSGRADRQITLRQFPEWLRRKVVLAVPSLERLDYEGAWPGQEVLPLPCKGIAETRRRLMEWCPTRFLLMIDDDMTFAYRPDMAKASLKSLPPGDRGVTNLFVYWRSLMRSYVHVGLSARQGNNHVHEPYKECCRMFNTYMYDLPVVRHLGVRYGRLPVMEDFDLTLQLLRLGYPNAVIYRWCWNQPGSNAPGGCSQYRTCEMQADAAARLAELHPGFVRVVQKESANWDGMNRRMDVTVYWKKAYESSGGGA
jgi:hypothetical protein